MTEEKSNLTLTIVVVAGFTAVIIFGLYLIYNQSASTSLFTRKQTEPMVCTQEIKICPDGSFVSRTGPNCEFTACPVIEAPVVEVPAVEVPVVEVNEIDNWLTYNNDKHGFEIKYPPNWTFYDIDNNFLIVNFCGPDYTKKDNCKTAGLNHTPVISLRNDIMGVKNGGFCANYPNSIYCKKELVLLKDNIKIDGRDAEIIEIKYGVNNDKNDLIVFWKNNPSDKRMYGLEVFKNYPEYGDVFNKMLSTFKFTK